jgi:hypothetical protein
MLLRKRGELAVRDDWEVERALPRAYFDPLAIDLFQVRR